MKIIILSLVSVFLANCGGGKNTDQWKAPNIYYLRSDGNKNTVLTNNDILQLNDYVYFSDVQTQAPSVEVMKKIDSEFTIRSQAKCVSEGKSFTAENTYKKDHVQLKEIIPIESSLFDLEMTTCKVSLQLINSKGSSKTFILPERNISLKDFPADLAMTEMINYQEFQSTLISDLKSNALVTLVCDSFSVSTLNPGVKSLTLEQLTTKLNTNVVDIPLQQYKANQFCRITLRSDNQKEISNKFLIQFEKLIPQYIFNNKVGYEGHTLFVYKLKITNPHSVPVSVGLRKASLKNAPFSLKTHHGHDNDYDKWTLVRQNLSIKFSDTAKVFDKEKVFVIHLKPGESVSASAFINPPKCTNLWCMENGGKHVAPQPIYNLEYNFRSVEEIERAENIKLTDGLNKN